MGGFFDALGVIAFLIFCIFLLYCLYKLIFARPKTEDEKKRFRIIAISTVALLVVSFGSYSISESIRESDEKEAEEIFKKNEEVFAKDAFLLKKKYDHTIQFDKGKSGLNVQAKAKLDSLIIDLMELKNKYDYDMSVTVVGHTSSEGDAKVNQKLSEERAKSCLDYIEKSGFNSYYNRSEGKGSSEPLDESKLELNRRIEFFFKLVK